MVKVSQCYFSLKSEREETVYALAVSTVSCSFTSFGLSLHLCVCLPLIVYLVFCVSLYLPLPTPSCFSGFVFLTLCCYPCVSVALDFSPGRFIIYVILSLTFRIFSLSSLSTLWLLSLAFPVSLSCLFVSFCIFISIHLRLSLCQFLAFSVPHFLSNS